MQKRTLLILLGLILCTRVLSSLYVGFSVLLLFVNMAFVPLIVLVWIMAGFMTRFKNGRVNRRLFIGSAGIAVSFGLELVALRHHNFTWLKQHQAENTVRKLELYHVANGIYPGSLQELHIPYFPGTDPTYQTHDSRTRFTLYWETHAFEDAVYTSQDKRWFYGD